MNTFKNVFITTGATLVLLGAIFIFAFSLPVSANFNDGIFSVHSASYAAAQGDSGGGDSGGDSGGGDSGGDSGGGDSGGDSGGGDSGGDSGGGDSGGDSGGGDSGGDSGGGDSGGDSGGGDSGGGTADGGGDGGGSCCTPTCPSGYSGVYPNCIPPQCPSGYTGTYPNCYPPQCPSGYTGTYPNCVPPQCPSGYTGTYPNCNPPQCPSGYTGTFPNCVPPTCPSGHTGTYPHCYPPCTHNCNPQPPVCEIWADEEWVGYGEGTTLRWDSTNATSATLSGVGSVAVDGSRWTGALYASQYYTLTVTGAGGTSQCMTTVHVDDEPQYDQPSCDIWADEEWIENGDGTTLHWDSEHASSANLTQFGSVEISGTRLTGALYATKTYTLNVWGEGGSAQCSVTVTVEDTSNSSPSCDIYADPTSVQQGNGTTLTWSSQNAASAHLSSVGGVPVDGNRTVYPWSTTTYTLTVYDWDGESAQCTTTVGVTSPPVTCGGNCNPPPCTTCGGHSGGSTDVSVYANNSNTNNNSNDNSNTNNITVNVPAPVVNNVYPSFPGYPGYQQPQYPNYPYPQYNQAPYCTITLSNHYGYGYDDDERTLTWYSTNANSAYINDIGSVPSSGSRAVWGDEYTMTVYGPGGTATCRTGNAYVPPPVYYPPVNNYPPVFHPIATAQQHPIAIAHIAPQAPIVRHVAAPFIALNQIPYTGFGLGEFGTAMYWLSIVMVAALGAGALVHFRSDMFSLAGMTSMFKKESRSARLREFLGEETLSFTPTRLLGIR